MAYEQLEEIRSRKREKVAMFLTAENMGGLLMATLPVYIATAQFQSFFLRMVLLVLAAVLGVVITFEIGGLALYERLLWRLRGLMRVQTAGALINPDQFSVVPSTTYVEALPADGPISMLPVIKHDTSFRGRRIGVPEIPKQSTTNVSERCAASQLSPFDEVMEAEAQRETRQAAQSTAEEAVYANV